MKRQNEVSLIELSSWYKVYKNYTFNVLMMINSQNRPLYLSTLTVAIKKV